MSHVSEECLLFRSKHILVDISQKSISLSLLFVFPNTSNHSLYGLLTFTNLLSRVPTAGLGLSEPDRMYASHPCQLSILPREHLLQWLCTWLYRI